jgi:carboxymethylenebutenolidase
MHAAQELRYRANGSPEIRSWFTSPTTSTVRPAALVLRGVAGPVDGYLEIARMVNDWGWHALIHHWQVRGNDPTDDEVTTDLAAAFDCLLKQPTVDEQRIAVMGFCKGGVYAFLAERNRPNVRAVAVFHGFCYRKLDDQRSQQPYDLARGVRAPMLLLHGTEDTSAPIDGLRQLNKRLQRCGAVSELHEYEGVGHGFAVSTHPGFAPDAAADAFHRAELFLRRYVEGA